MQYNLRNSADWDPAKKVCDLVHHNQMSIALQVKGVTTRPGTAATATMKVRKGKDKQIRYLLKVTERAIHKGLRSLAPKPTIFVEIHIYSVSYNSHFMPSLLGASTDVVL